MRKFALALSLVLLSGCITYVPPVDTGVEYSLMGVWFPNQAVDSLWFMENGLRGHILVTDDTLIFGSYDKDTNTFIKTFSMAYSEMTWVNKKVHSHARFLQIGSEDGVNSFATSIEAKDAAFDYVIAHME